MKKRTFFGRLWRDAVKGATANIPIVNNIVANKINKNDAPEGKIDIKRLPVELIAGITVLLLIVLLALGILSQEQILWIKENLLP